MRRNAIQSSNLKLKLKLKIATVIFPKLEKGKKNKKWTGKIVKRKCTCTYNVNFFLCVESRKTQHTRCFCCPSFVVPFVFRSYYFISIDFETLSGICQREKNCFFIILSFLHIVEGWEEKRRKEKKNFFACVLRCTIHKVENIRYKFQMFFFLFLLRLFLFFLSVCTIVEVPFCILPIVTKFFFTVS